MKINQIVILVMSIFLSLNLGAVCFADAPPEQEASGQEQMRRLQEKEKEMREKIEQKKPVLEIEKKLPEAEAPPAPSDQKAFIQRVNVTGATLITAKEIKSITAIFENKELTVREMQKVADLITDAYRQKGYITSRAYLPPQKIEANVLEVRVAEGMMGDIEVKGNRYFKSELLKKKIALKKGDPFDYRKFQAGLSKINQYPDRNAKAVLVPGKEPGTTDAVLEVKDHLPVHIGFTTDNFGSRYIDEDRYLTTLKHNNFLGHDDILTLQYQAASSERYRLASLRYLYPVNDLTEIGFFAGRTKLTLGREYENLSARGKSKLYSLYLTRHLMDKENLSLSMNLGLDYKDIFNFQMGEETSRDRLRVTKLGMDLDLSDKFGRTLISNEVACGIPDILQGLDDVDLRSSRTGSGGRFTKDTLNILRLHKMPLSSILFLKSQAQTSPYILPAAEEFQVGGIANVRGYPPAEYVGDKGCSATAELSMPLFFAPKIIKDCPMLLSKGKVYDTVRAVTFYDWGYVRLHRPLTGEEKERTVRGAGCGVRVNFSESFSTRVDVAWPLDKKPSDKENVRTWFEIVKEF